MKNIYSNIFSFNKKTLNKSVASLKKGNVVGLPTETVYGLAGNAYSKKAVKKIYSMKKRPKKNPLIVHYLNHTDADKDVILNNDFYRLYKIFCPGPITFVLKKKNKSKIQSLVAANLDSLAIRFPSHTTTRSVLKRLNFPLAMPSANMASGISPVNAYDVANEFKKKIELVINGGDSKIGLESTVISLIDKPQILRPGVIGLKTIDKFLKVKIIKTNSSIRSPGMMKKHYSPGIPVILNQKSAKENCALITFGKRYKDRPNFFNLSKNSDLKEAASNLYKTFRKIKNQGYKKIHVVKIPNKDIGIAINDRLKRASN